MANGILLNLDTTKSEFQNPMIELRQGDGNYQSLDVTVTSNGEPFDLTGWTTTFMGTTAGGHKIVDSDTHVINALQGEFTYTPTKSWGQDQGEFKNAYFKFTKADETASGASFRVNVLDAVDLTDEEAGNYISVVDVLINDIKTSMDTKLADTQKTLSDTQSQATTVQGNVNNLNTNVNELKAQNNAIKTTDNTWTGGNTFQKSTTMAGIEVMAGIPFVDFHFGNDSGDYTSRIAEFVNGELSINGVRLSGGTVLGTLNGNASSATKLKTPRKINGTNFDGTADINVNSANDSNLVHRSDNETVAGDKTFTGNVIATKPINGFLQLNYPTVTDLNNLTTSGSYLITNSILNAPASMPNGAVINVSTFDVNVTYQVITARDDTSIVSGNVKTWVRGKVGSTWANWRMYSLDDTVVHNTGTETVAGDKTFTGTNNFSGATTLKAGNYGLRVKTTGIQKTSDNGVTWTNI